MNKLACLFVLGLLTIISCGFSIICGAAELEQMSNKQPIKVYLASFSNESGEKDLKVDELKQEVEKAFANRKSVRFEIVKSPAESDVQVFGIIKKFQYLTKDPVRPAISVALMALDAAITENFVEMDVQFTIINTKTGALIWKDNVVRFLKRSMTRAQSIPLIYDKIARAFVSKSFGKGR
ncbi:MAG: hypothetical protein NC938_05055 [Candidatus Omnitrophica bacterium]|nr:hypothetical protein [Candidatus Omnitrophota bacterium]